MQCVFTPCSKKGQEFQLFVPPTCILKHSHSIDNQDVSVATQLALKSTGDDSFDDVKMQQVVAVGKSKKEASIQKARHELQLDDRDIDDTMNAGTQQKIWEEIKQQRGNTQQLKGIEASKNNKATFAGLQQDEHHHIPPGSDHPIYPITQAGERKPLRHYLHVDRQEQQEHKDRDLQSARHLDNPVKTLYSSSGKSNYFTFYVN